jgi:hypothetical protein
MLDAQKEILNYCGRLESAIKPANIAETIAQKIPSLADEAKVRDLLVPVVGAFNSGKSTLINTLLGTPVLPVARTPETSLAMELHYAVTEFIEAIKSDGSTVRYSVEEIKKLSAEAASYSYARLYLNNKRLQELEPLILVDMPGFDSPLDAHNKAIMVYLDRGCHYIVLSSVEEGTVTKSLLRRLHEIDEWGREFNFFLSKSNFKPSIDISEDISELQAHYNQAIRDFGISTEVIPVGNESAESVVQVLKNIDADRIFFGLYRDRLGDICNECIDSLNIKLKASEKDVGKITAVIQEMNDSILKLEKKAEEETANIQQRYSSGMIRDIVSDVGRELESSMDELVAVASSGKQEELKMLINEIVRSALTVSVKNKLGDINRQIVTDFSSSLQSLDKIMKDFDIDDNYIQRMSDRIKNVFFTFGGFDEKGKPGDQKTPAFGSVGYKAFAGVLAATTTIVATWLEVIIIFLPEIIKIFSFLFGDGQQSRNNEIRSKLVGEVFPKIKRKIREEIPSTLEPQITAMIEQVRVQYKEKIEAQKVQIGAAIEEQNKNAAERERERGELVKIRADVQAIAGEILSWGK